MFFFIGMEVLLRRGQVRGPAASCFCLGWILFFLILPHWGWMFKTKRTAVSAVLKILLLVRFMRGRTPFFWTAKY